MPRERSAPSELAQRQRERELRDQVEASLALLVGPSGPEYLAQLIDQAGGELEVDQLEQLPRTKIHPDKIHGYLTEALRDGVLEIVRRKEEEWVRRPLDARLLDLLDKRGRRRGLRWAALERLLHCSDQRRRLTLACALVRQAEAGRVELRGHLYRRARPPP